MKIPRAEVKVEYIPFEGGLDQSYPYLVFPPGAILESKNYVPDKNKGYKRIDGYERYDGQAAPSDATYKNLTVTFAAGESVSNGETVTGDTSGATGVVANYGTSKINVTKVTGTFQAEDITVGGTTVATITAVADSESSDVNDATARNAAADIYRADISKPAGDNPVRGLCMLDGTLYAFVDNAGGTAGQIFKATASGWSEVSVRYELSFDQGVGLLSDGDDITQDVSGATATIERVVLTSGAWGTDASGKLIISSISGTFNTVDALRVSGTTQAYASSTQSEITRDPAGRYEFVINNFYADLDRKRIYGCDGVNRGFEFDGDVYTPIDVPLSTGVSDTPLHVTAHKKQLFFSYNSGVMHSGVGYPYEYTAASGANFISLGDTITGTHVLPGQALAIFARSEIAQLIGNNIDDYQVDGISNEIGAIPYTIQRMGHVFCLDDRGIIQVEPTEAYGNFAAGTISSKIQLLINDFRSVVTASGVYRAEDQYRLYGSDGSGLCMTNMGDRYDFSYFEYPHNVSCTFSGEDENGKEVFFFGTSDGWVMQGNKGSSFDGNDIESYIILPFANSEAPTLLKSYRKAVLDITCSLYSSLDVSSMISFGKDYYPKESGETINVTDSDDFWSVNNWDTFDFSRNPARNPSLNLNGTGLNLSLSIYSKSSIDLGHKISGAVFHYTPRRLSR